MPRKGTKKSQEVLVDFQRYEHRPVHYSSDKRLDSLHTANTEEAAAILPYLVFSIQPILEKDISWMQGRMVDPRAGNRLLFTTENGKCIFYEINCLRIGAYRLRVSVCPSVCPSSLSCTRYILRTVCRINSILVSNERSIPLDVPFGTFDLFWSSGSSEIDKKTSKFSEKFFNRPYLWFLWS